MGLPHLFEITINGKSFPVVWAVIGLEIFTFVMDFLRRCLLDAMIICDFTSEQPVKKQLKEFIIE